MIQATFSGFNTALSALRANQARLSVVGQNLSNMNTEGYTRQELNVKSVNYSNPDFFMDKNNTSIGYGVSMTGVAQLRDQFLDIQYRDQNSKVSYNNTVSDALDSLDSYLDETQIDGLSTSFNNIQTALTNMQDPSKVNDPVYEGELRSRMSATANLLNNAASEITSAKVNEYHNLDGSGSSENGDVDKVNQLLADIGDLNIKIKKNQLVGNSVLELQDERNQKIDELSGYIPIEVSYFTEKYMTVEDGKPVVRDRGLNYNAEGVATGKSAYPEDLKIDMVYTATDKDGSTTTKRINLVNGSSTKDQTGSTVTNYGSVNIKIGRNGGDSDSFRNVFDAAGNRQISYTGSADEDVELEFSQAGSFYTFEKDGVTYDSHYVQTGDTYTASVQTDNTVTADDKSGVRLAGGSMQAHLDMLTDNYSSQNNGSTYRSFDYYMKRLDNLASSFSTNMNILNAKGVYGYQYNGVDSLKDADSLKQFADEELNFKSFLLLVSDENTPDGITAANIRVSQDWVNGTTHIGTKGDPANGNSSTDTVLNMLQDITSTHRELDNKTYSNEMDSISTYLANDSYNNSNALKTNQAVLDSISTAKDQLSGVSLDEEAANMMTYVTSYNAAARLMTALDETLQSLLGIA